MKKSDGGDQTARDFGDWLREQLTRRGYNLGMRGGGQSRFADDSGINRATVSRLLRGEHAPDVRTLQLLARALGLPLGEILVRAGIVTPDELGAVQQPFSGQRRITPEQAADELGITDPQARRVFVNLADTLRTPPPDNNSGEGKLAGQ